MPAFDLTPTRPGFSMLELTLVVAILATVAGLVIASLAGVQGDAELKVARSDLAAIRDAVQRFRDDTGYLPRQGPFALVDDGGVIDPAADSHWPADLQANSPAQRRSWFALADNIYQLRLHRDDANNPLLAAGCLDRTVDRTAEPDTVRTWNENTGRGYRGPYLSGRSRVAVVPSLPEVPVSLDPWGQPYLLFLDAPATSGQLGPRVLSLGPDGELASDGVSIAGDDLAALIE